MMLKIKRKLKFKIKDTDIVIWLKGIEPYMRTVKIDGRVTTEKTTALFHPIRRIKFRIKTFIEWNWLKYIKKQNPKRCVSCGEGIAKTTISDPNGSDESWDVCYSCVTWIDDCFKLSMDIIMKKEIKKLENKYGKQSRENTT